LSRRPKRDVPLPVLRSRLVPIFLRRARELDVSIGHICERYQVPPDALELAEVSIGLAAFRAFAAEIAESARDELFGFHAALASNRGDFGVLEYVGRNAPTVLAALERLGQYGRAINAQVRVTFDARTGRVTETIPGFPECLGRHGNDFAVAHKVKIGRELLGPTFAPTRVFFAHAPPPDLRELRTFFHGSELVHHADFNGLELPPALLAAPLHQADPALLELMEERLGAIAREVEHDDPLELLRRAVAEDLAAADVNGDLLASRLGMSRRTLHRRLAAAGVSLRMLIDDVRRDMAKAYLAEPNRPLRDIATRLGYSDARAFARAFVRWTGETPASYRNALPPPAP
jgi:AraC-like DNA-binding protein